MAFRDFLKGGLSFRAALLLAIGLLLLPSAISAATYTPTSLQAGTIDDPANGTTVISTQGFGGENTTNEKKPARLVGVGPRGGLEWVHNGSERGIAWFYDVDPLPGENLLVTGTRPEGTVVYSWNPDTDETAWTERLDMDDTHDVDLVNGDQLLIANMRNYNESTGRNDDRILLYDRSSDEVVWEWKFREHYEKSAGGAYTGDWTHVNDVDKIGPGRYVTSPRRMDQVIVVNRSTKDIEMRLGSDENHDVLYAQHNPQYLVGENGTPTMLVANSETDRVVEYAKSGDGWTRTWTLGTNESLNWPRDADRLPNGNTLIADTLNHRVFEVTPRGQIIWEFYATWGPYDVERIQLGDEPGGPTVRELNATGQYNVSGSAGVTPGSRAGSTLSQRMVATFAGTPIEPQVRWFASRWTHVTPWIRPVWMGSWDFLAATGAALLTLVWGAYELLSRRKRLAAAVRARV